MPAGYDFEAASPQAEPGVGTLLDPNAQVDPQERLRDAFARLMLQQPQGQAVPLNDLAKMRLDNMQPPMDRYTVDAASPLGQQGYTIPTPPAAAATPGTDFPMPETYAPARPKPVPPPYDAITDNAFPGANSLKVLNPGDPDYIGGGDKAFKLPNSGTPTIGEVWKQGVHELPEQPPDLPARDRAAPQQSAPPLPDQNPFPMPPGLGPQSSSAFKLPLKIARAKEFGVDDFGDPRDIVGRGDGSGTA